MFFEHGTHGNIDGAAAAIGRDHLALEVLNLVDATVLANIELFAEIAGDAILEFIGDNADVVEPRIFDRDGKRGISEVGDLQFVIRDRRDHLRRALVADGFERVGFAQMHGQIFFLEND
jgi:hypothetical protein